MLSMNWPAKDIIYVSLIGPVMLMALVEWGFWMFAFLYCLFRVYQKASGKGKWSIRILCVLNTVVFTVMRCIFLPVMVVTLPLPPMIVQRFPKEAVSFLQWFAFYSFAVLLTVPWLFCVYQLVTNPVGRKQRIQTMLIERSAPKAVVIMPCYNEKPDILIRTVDSLVDCEYPPSCLHIYLSFDGDEVNEIYLKTIAKLGVQLIPDWYPTSIDLVYRACRITVSRFPHGGKRCCQKTTFRLIDKMYAEYLRKHDDLFLLFIDSDCILDKVCIQNFMYGMELKPGSRRDKLAMTGVITATTSPNRATFLSILQDIEYVHGQLFERSVESACGAVTCLPGALTMLRFSAFRKIAKYYFADKAEQCEDWFDYGKCHLGEDRWLTHLLMIAAKARYQIQMSPGAFCKTEAVLTFKSLVKQRRRWFLGFITNEACMLTDIRLWRRYPLLLTIRLAQNTIRTTALLFFIMLFALVTTSQQISNLPTGFIAVVLGLNWALMVFFGLKLHRYKVMLYPLMFVVNPFFNWIYLVYGLSTAGHRTWGGPRADAVKADADTSPEQAVAKAEAQGDDLNVALETFSKYKGSVETEAHSPAPLLPPSYLEGRFTAADELPGGWFQQRNDSGALNADMTFHRGLEAESTGFAASNMGVQSSMPTPRRVESFMNQEGVNAYHLQQLMQKPAGGLSLEPQEAVLEGHTRVGDGLVPNHAGSTDAESAASNSSVALHFDVPWRIS